MRTLGRVVRGLVALSALVALLVGVPWALWHYISWPLPHALPTWEQVSQALNSNGIPDALLFNSLAVVCWAAWAALAVSVAAEVPAAIRGVTARRVPLAGPMQTLARHLVAAVLVLLPPVTSRPAAALSPSPVTWSTTARPVAALATPFIASPTRAHQTLDAPAGPGSYSPTSSIVAADAKLPRHHVAPKETLWGLAEKYLGDPLRWREIFDLNQGRPQPNGERLTDEDLIRPGWVLLLPADARVPQTVSPNAPPAGAGSNSNGQQGPAGPSGEEPGAPQPSEQPSTTTSSEHKDRHSPNPIVELPLGGVVGLSLALAISAALAAARLHRRRRWQPADPAPDIAGDDPLVTDTVRRLDHAARVTTQQDDDAEDDQPARPPSGSAERPSPLPRIEPGPFGVVVVSHHDGTELALDLPAAGGLALTGPGAVAAVRALVVAALARNQQTAAVEVVVAGADFAGQLLPNVGAVPGLEIVADLDAALRHLEVEALHRARLLDDSGQSTIKEFRQNHPAEPLPLLMLVSGTPAPVLAGRLAALLDCAQRFGIGVVIVGEAQGMNALGVGADGEIADLPAVPGPLDQLRGARMMMLHPDQGQEALALVAASHGEPPVPLAGRSTVAATGASQAATGADTSAAPADAAPRSLPMPALAEGESRPVLVRLLGPLRIEVNEREVRKGLRGKAREFLALLLIRPEGVDSEVAVETLWPDVPPPRGAERFQTTLSNLRVTLRTATGLEKADVVDYSAGRYQFQLDLVDCDLWRFRNALAAAANASEAVARTAALQRAVAAYGGTLVEGERYGWVEPLREELRRRALDAATSLTDFHDRNGDISAAIAVLEQAITWDPYAEELYRRLMRLNASLRRLDDIRRVFQRLTTRLEELDADPDDATQRLFTELVGPTVRRIH